MSTIQHKQGCFRPSTIFSILPGCGLIVFAPLVSLVNLAVCQPDDDKDTSAWRRCRPVLWFPFFLFRVLPPNSSFTKTFPRRWNKFVIPLIDYFNPSRRIYHSLNFVYHVTTSWKFPPTPGVLVALRQSAALGRIPGVFTLFIIILLVLPSPCQSWLVTSQPSTVSDPEEGLSSFDQYQRDATRNHPPIPSVVISDRDRSVQMSRRATQSDQETVLGPVLSRPENKVMLVIDGLPYFGFLLALVVVVLLVVIFALVFWCSHHRSGSINNTLGSGDVCVPSLAKGTTACHETRDDSRPPAALGKPDNEIDYLERPSSVLSTTTNNLKEESNGEASVGDQLTPPISRGGDSKVLCNSCYLCANCCPSAARSPVTRETAQAASAVLTHTNLSEQQRQCATASVGCLWTSSPDPQSLVSRRAKRQTFPVPKILPTTALHPVVELRTVTVQPSAIPGPPPSSLGGIRRSDVSPVLSSSPSLPTSPAGVVANSRTQVKHQPTLHATPSTRNRARGLLERRRLQFRGDETGLRRGSHTSLTLPSFDMMDQNSSSNNRFSSIAGGAPRYGSLDETTATASAGTNESPTLGPSYGCLLLLPQSKLSGSSNNLPRLGCPTSRSPSPLHHLESDGGQQSRAHADGLHAVCLRAGGGNLYPMNRDIDQLMSASLPLSPEELTRKPRECTQTLFSEFWAIPMNHVCKKEFPIIGIGAKNRYESILPNFHSRVVLPMVNNDLTTTYINANYIHGYNGQPNSFIATQGPMCNTVVDFWRMVWFARAPAIVMITKLVERRDVKCELYLPTSSKSSSSSTTRTKTSVEPRGDWEAPPVAVASPLQASNPSVLATARQTTLGALGEMPDLQGAQDCKTSSGSSRRQAGVSRGSEAVSPPGTVRQYGDVLVAVLTLDDRSEGYTVRQLRLTCQGETREVKHFWYTAWPDHSSPETTPASAGQLLRLVKAVELCRSPTPQKQELADSGGGDDPATSSGPIVVHCSAGIGRTGCFLALCIGCQQLRQEGIVDVLKIVSRLRLDRGGIVQTNEQYEFIHHALAVYLTHLNLDE